MTKLICRAGGIPIFFDIRTLYYYAQTTEYPLSTARTETVELLVKYIYITDAGKRIEK